MLGDSVGQYEADCATLLAQFEVMREICFREMVGALQLEQVVALADSYQRTGNQVRFRETLQVLGQKVGGDDMLAEHFSEYVVEA